MNGIEFLPILMMMLPRTERMFLNLWANHDMTQEEIADIFDCTEDHVDEVLNRAIERYGRLSSKAERHMSEAIL